jgi:hypothetical protein
MTRQAGFKRRVRARMAKTGESYATARSRVLDGHPGAVPDDSPLDWMPEALHISNGDATDVPGTGLARRVVYWRDVLHEGPVPEVAPAELRRIRADYLTGHDSAKRAETTPGRPSCGPRRGRRGRTWEKPCAFAEWTGWLKGRTHCSASIRPAAPWSGRRVCA